LIWRSGAEGPRQAAGHEKLKDHQNFDAETAGDYSTTFDAVCKGRDHIGPPILLSHAGADWKKILRNYALYKPMCFD